MPEKVAPPRWLKPMNAVLLVARRLGLGWTRELPVLVLPGRKTGKLRHTPVSVLDLEGHRYLLAGWPGADWAANARAAGVGILTVGKRNERVRLVELSPPTPSRCCVPGRPASRRGRRSCATAASSPTSNPTPSPRWPGGARSSGWTPRESLQESHFHAMTLQERGFPASWTGTSRPGGAVTSPGFRTDQAEWRDDAEGRRMPTPAQPLRDLLDRAVAVGILSTYQADAVVALDAQPAPGARTRGR